MVVFGRPMSLSAPDARGLWFRVFPPAAALTALTGMVWSFWAVLLSVSLFAAAAAVVVRRQRPGWTWRRVAAFASTVLVFELLTLAVGVAFMGTAAPFPVPSTGAVEAMTRPLWVNLVLFASLAVWVLGLPLGLAAVAASFGLERAGGWRAAALFLVVLLSTGNDMRGPNPLLVGGALLAFGVVFLPHPSNGPPAPTLADTVTDTVFVAAGSIVVVVTAFPWLSTDLKGYVRNLALRASVGFLWPLFLCAVTVGPALTARRRGETGGSLARIVVIMTGLLLPVAVALAALAAGRG